MDKYEAKQAINKVLGITETEVQGVKIEVPSGERELYQQHIDWEKLALSLKKKSRFQRAYEYLTSVLNNIIHPIQWFYRLKRKKAQAIEAKRWNNILKECYSDSILLQSLFNDVARRRSLAHAKICDEENLVCCAHTYTDSIGVTPKKLEFFLRNEHEDFKLGEAVCEILDGEVQEEKITTVIGEKMNKISQIKKPKEGEVYDVNISKRAKKNGKDKL